MIQIGHLMPVTVEVVAYGAFPQVYPCLPRGRLPQYHSAELEYQAIQSLTEDFIRNVRQPDDLSNVARNIHESRVTEGRERGCREGNRFAGNRRRVTRR